MFFTYETDLPEGSGYNLFDHKHILLIGLCFLFILICVLIYKKSSPELRTILKKSLGTVPFVLILSRMAYVLFCNESIIYEMPLHLCSMAGIICLVHSLTKGFLSQVLFSLCMPGAILAIIFPDGTMYPLLHFITIESYLFHSLIIAYVCFILIEDKTVPSIKESYKSVLFLIFTVPFVYLYNLHFHTNFMFLMGPSFGSPLKGIYDSYGYPGYLVVFGILALAEIFIINLLFQMLISRSLHRPKQPL